MKDFFSENKLASFMRKKELRHLVDTGELHWVYYNNEIVGFYCVVSGTMLKSVYIKPCYRGLGLATKTIKEVISKYKTLTVATILKRECQVKKMIRKFGFQPTGKIVQGKQSKLEIWAISLD